MRKKRRFSTFSLSFLDIMSCGFGAVALVFLIIKHDVDQQHVDQPELRAEANMLDIEILDGQKDLVAAKNTLSQLDQQMVEAQGLATRIEDEVNAARQRLQTLMADQNNDTVDSLKEQIEKLQQKKEELEKSQQQQGNNSRDFVGIGNRQYLTGLKLGGRRVLILLDASASMLDERIVNIVRQRNLPPEQRRQSSKWRRSVATVDWLTAQLPQKSQYQLYTFNTDVRAAISRSENTWLNVSDAAELEQALVNLRMLAPEGGTSLERAFQAVAALSPLPDNIYLITDGLPTQGISKPKSNTVTSPQRLKFFNQALSSLPGGIPINVILLPMEGDPMAAAALWQLAQESQGSFLSPSKDWP